MLRAKIITKTDKLIIRELNDRRYEMPMHAHDEYELVYVVSGNGKRFIGESMEPYYAGDLTFIGPNTPHLFLSDEKYYRTDDFDVHWWVIQFSKDIFPGIINSSDTFKPIARLLHDSDRGISFDKLETKKHFLKSIQLLKTKNGLDRITSMYYLLDYLSKDNAYRLLCETAPEKSTYTNNDTVNKIYQYLLSNYKKEIKLDTISELVCMQVATMCTYYKRHTLRSIIETLIEIRINHACKLLVNSNLDIYQVAYESGFKNISNFNRQFLKLKTVTPKVYRNAFKQNS